FYGDTRLLQIQYPSMRAWVEFMRASGEDELLFGDGFHFGDWLALDTGIDGAVFGATDVLLIGSAFYAWSTHLLAQIAELLGNTADAQLYADLHKRIVAAFQREFVTPAGRLASNTQTAYVLALMFDLLTEPQREEAVRRLVADIRRRDLHLSTGFLGTPYLCPVLERYGQLDVAYALLLQESYPSWLFPVLQGATTIWERWDGQRADGSFQTPGMNSFNHYAYGAVGEWMYSVIGGIRPMAPGFKKILFAPEPGGGLTEATTSLHTPHGLASCWAPETTCLSIPIMQRTRPEMDRAKKITAGPLTAAIDFGISNTDVVVRQQGTLQTWSEPYTADPDPASVGALLAAGGVALDTLPWLAVTGGRHRVLPSWIGGTAVRKVDEVQAIGRGGQALLGLEGAARDELLLVASCGSGTALIAAQGDRFAHVSGSAVGGGTLLGLARLILDTVDPLEIETLSAAGDRNQVDLSLADVITGPIGTLPADATAVNFGRLGRPRLQELPRRPDLAADDRVDHDQHGARTGLSAQCDGRPYARSGQLSPSDRTGRKLLHR
ncbi:MAG: hypothetical protein NTV69_15675, partial [Caldilinea sp.]|nr:hypothetical protein [Caldilinea sp.]